MSSVYSLGIDEAGRGPVIGPMVIAGVIFDISNKNKLEEAREKGIKDSKQLSASKREELFNYIVENFPYKYTIIPPSKIDTFVGSDAYTINDLEAMYSAGIVNYFILKNINIDRVVLDCPSTNKEAYKNKIKTFLSKKVEIVAEHKADQNYIEVAAASIIAKVIRDRIIEKIKKETGIDFGSGYPSDPTTRAFLEKYFDKFNIFRKSWSSWTRAMEKNEGKEKDEKLNKFFK